MEDMEVDNVPDEEMAAGNTTAYTAKWKIIPQKCVERVSILKGIQTTAIQSPPETPSEHVPTVVSNIRTLSNGLEVTIEQISTAEQVHRSFEIIPDASS
jgi:hypothetical protein